MDIFFFFKVLAKTEYDRIKYGQSRGRERVKNISCSSHRRCEQRLQHSCLVYKVTGTQERRLFCYWWEKR
jgi:hypothetical protein